MQNLNHNNHPVVLNGVVEYVTFHNAENGFCVLRIKVRESKDLITVVGNIPAIASGETVNISGKWNTDGKYGLQLVADSICPVLPSTIDGLRKYLGSGLIKGIGPHFASKIVDYFGVEAMQIIEFSPHRLTEVAGIGSNRAELVAKSWTESKTIRDIMIFLQGHGVSIALARKIFCHYGTRALEVVKENPYQLARDIRGIGFLSADKIALALNFMPDSPQRARAALSYMLQEAATNGHCALPETKLLDKAEKDLRVKRDVLIEALSDEIKQKHLILMVIRQDFVEHTSNLNERTVENKNKQQCVGEGAFVDHTVLGGDTLDGNNNTEDCIGRSEEQRLVFLPIYLHYERYIAQKILDINRASPTLSDGRNMDEVIAWLDGAHHINLSNSQKEALIKVMSNKVSVITGGPGTGKTTLINSVIKILQNEKLQRSEENSRKQYCKVRIKLAAPTGRAAKRLADSTRHYATTIHRLLEFEPHTGGFKYNESRSLICDLLIIDESSMIDVHLMFALLKAVAVETTVIFVGDVDQIPSIGPGQVLKDIINSDAVSVTRLGKIFRQAANSNIVVNAHLVNKGVMPRLICGRYHISSTMMQANTVLGAGDALGLHHHTLALQNKGILADFLFYEVSDGQSVLHNIADIFKHDLPRIMENKVMRHASQNTLNGTFDIKRDVQVLSPMQKGSAGVKAINIELQKILNPNASTNYVEVFGQTYAVSDKVMQTENNYDKMVFNGDIGYIKSINREERVIVVDFDGCEVEYEFHEMDQLALAYAVTIHKAQGSEYPVIVVVIIMQHFIMLNRNLLYTSITRGRNLVILVGQKNAIATAVRNNSVSMRYTRLKDWLAIGD